MCVAAATVMMIGCAPKRGTDSRGAAAATRTSDRTEIVWPGRKADGSVQLPNQWSLRPVGEQIELGDFPVNIAVHPGGRFAAVLHCGYGPHQILCVDLVGLKVASRTRVNEAFYGLEFSGDGKNLYCSGASDEVVRGFEFNEGTLTAGPEIRLREAKLRGVPAGLAVDRAGRTLWVANLWGQNVSRVSFGGEPQVSEIAISTNVAAQAQVPVTPSPDLDTAAADKRDEAVLYAASSAEPFPYACRVDEQRQRLYVSLWAQQAVAVFDLKSSELLARWPTQEHPCEMVLARSGKFLFVANASRNTVTVFDADSGKVMETIWAALYPNCPPGSTPNSLALSPDEDTLFVANADNNVVAVFDVSRPGKSRSLGFIPVGWYPTSVRVTPDGKHLLVANGKGLTSKANPLGPAPGRKDPPVTSTNRTSQYIGQLFRGSLSVIRLPGGPGSSANWPTTRRRLTSARRSSPIRECPLRDRRTVRFR